MRKLLGNRRQHDGTPRGPSDDVGEVEPGQWLLVFLDSAREILTEEQALQLNNALLAVDQAINGNLDVDHLFADLIERDRLPPHLQELSDKNDG